MVAEVAVAAVEVVPGGGPKTVAAAAQSHWSQKDVGPGGWRPGEDPRGPDGWRPGDPVAPRRGDKPAVESPPAAGHPKGKPRAKVQLREVDDPSQSVEGKAGAEVTGFVYSRGFKKTPFVKVEWNEKLKDHNLGPTYGLDPRQQRTAAAGRRAKRLPLSPRERQLHGPLDPDNASDGSGGSQQASVLEIVDPAALLDPTIQLTMPGLQPEENAQLRERVLAKIEAQIAEIQRRLIRRRDKMDKLGFLSQQQNQARVEAMLKLEIRKRIRIDELKEVVLSEMWQEKAKLEPQEGLFANLEAKLHNILDAVGSIETVNTSTSRGSKAGVAAQKSNASSVDSAGAGGGRFSATAEQQSGTSRRAEAEPKQAPQRAPEIPESVLEGATEEDLLSALREKRAARSHHEHKVPKQADRVQGPWRELPEWTTRTQRLRQAGDGDSPKAHETAGDASEYGSEYSDENDAIPMVQMGVPHMFGDCASLHAGELKIKGAEAVGVPEGTDWLLSSPTGGEDFLTGSSRTKKKENKNYQTYDLSKERNDASVLDELFGDLDIGLDNVPGLRAAGQVVDGPPAIEADIGGSFAALGVMDGADGTSKAQYDDTTEWQVAGNRAAAGTVSELYQASSNTGGPYRADDSAVTMKVGRGPSYREEALRDQPAPGAAMLDETAVKREIQETMEARREKGRKLRESKMRVPTPTTADPAYAVNETQADRDAAATAGLTPADFDAPRHPSPEPLPPDVQHRLENVWADLRMPVMAKLDMAVKYTAAGGTTQLITEALPKWESAAMLIKEREAIIAVIKESVEFLENGEAPRTAFGQAKIMAAHKNFKSFNVELLVQLCKELRNRHGDEVTYDGTPYLEQLGDRNTRKLVAAFDEAIASSACLALPRTKE